MDKVVSTVEKHGACHPTGIITEKLDIGRLQKTKTLVEFRQFKMLFGRPKESKIVPLGGKALAWQLGVGGSLRESCRPTTLLGSDNPESVSCRLVPDPLQQR